MKRKIFGLLLAMMALVLMGCPNPATDASGTDAPATDTSAADQAITLLAIPGVTAPVINAAPVTTAIDTEQYTGTVAWSGTPGRFAGNTVYTATIVLTAKTGWTLTGVAANSFTVAGATATNGENSGTIAAVFPATAHFTMVSVPAGKFSRNASVIDTSYVSAFRMSAHEITRAHFAALLATDPAYVSQSSGTNDPVQYVNWYHAIAFCNKLSLAEGLTPVYAVTGVDFTSLTYAAIPTANNATWDAATATWTNTGYRLPTEMEWMWAAMGAPLDGQGGGTNISTTGSGKAFAGSNGTNSLGDYAVYDYYGSGTGRTLTARTNPVGSKLPNELGLYDMSGNVSEWIWDWNGTYPMGGQNDYRGPASGSQRDVRGGSWSSGAAFTTVAYRSSDAAYGQSSYYGFRVVRL